MDKINIPDDLMAEIEAIDNEIKDAKYGLTYLTSVLKTRTVSLWTTIKEALPETNGWVLRINLKEKVITKLYPEESSHDRPPRL